MREIKFRGKPVYYGGKAISWVYGTFKYIPCNVISPGATDNGRRELRHDKGIIIEPYYGSEFEALCDTVGQYTGLKDKNGKDIYEGDIVELRQPDGNCVPCEVSFCEKGYWAISFGINERVILGYINRDQIEVIGNIHDNSELLNRKRI